MAKYILKRILWMIPIIFGVVLLVFTIMYFSPIDAAYAALGTNATPEAIATFNAKHGLDQGYFERLFNYCKGILQFDFGTSYISGADIGADILSRLPYTLMIGLIGLAIAVVLGITLGVTAATHQNTWIDNVCMIASMFFTSMPAFWFALIMVMFFSLKLGWLPVVGFESWKNYVIPCLAVGVGCAARIARQTRSSMLEVIRQDYVTTARAKGQTERVITYKHCLRNGMIPVLTVIGTQMAYLCGASLVCEQIFSIPGIGVYMFSGINTNDTPVILGCVIVISIYFSIVMLLTDIVYTFVDPRMKNMLISKAVKNNK